jgi:hypothetical protein
MKTLQIKKPKVPEGIDPMFNRIFVSVLGGLCASHGRTIEEYGEKDELHVTRMIEDQLADAVMAAWQVYLDIIEVRRFESKL